MKTKYIAILMAIFAMGSSGLCQSPWKQIGFIEKIVPPGNDFYRDSYRPKLRLIGDTLYVASNSGLYRKDLRLPGTEFELCGLGGIPVVDVVKNGDRYLVMAAGTRQLNDSLLFLSTDGGKSFTNVTPSLFVKYDWNAMYQFAQNPQNPSSLLVASGVGLLYQSFDLGEHWHYIELGLGGSGTLKYHPLDTTVVFYTGENQGYTGVICKIEDNGKKWFGYEDGESGVIYDVAFHPQNADVMVYIAMTYGRSTTLAKSTDKGETWRKMSGIDDEHLRCVFFDEKRPDTLYAWGESFSAPDRIVLYRSTNRR